MASYQLYMVTGDTAVNISNDTSAPVPQVHEKEKLTKHFGKVGKTSIARKFDVRPEGYGYYVISNCKVRVEISIHTTLESHDTTSYAARFETSSRMSETLVRV